MIHAKLFTRRLALAAGLMLGWTSGAAADIKLLLDGEDLVMVREEAGRTEITVTAKNYAAGTTGPLANVLNDTHVNLQSSTTGLNTRFLITQTTLVIPRGESQASGTITFTAIDDTLMGVDNTDDGYLDDLVIEVGGSAGALNVVEAIILLIDNDKASTAILLSFSQTTLSKRAGPTDIVVTAELDGKVH